tara:strand:- start:69 stop:644 length:576 start_codon:yes stop_codon:yes gene_type:complete
MTTLVIIGNDKIGGKALKAIHKCKNIEIYCDRSTNIKRLIKLLKRKKISIFVILKMLLAEILRKGNKPNKNIFTIKSNQTLLEIIKKNNYEKVILFRAGLILNKKVIDFGVNILNIHAASLPNFAGIGAINKALTEKVYQQKATLHRLIETIDSGEIISEIDYRLDPNKSYLANENIAYSAAIKLLVKTLN